MGHVYFIQETETGAIKIGWSSNLRKRLAALQISNHSKLKLLAAYEGCIGEEKDTQDHFKEFRIRGEWFRPNEDLMRVIEKNKISLTEKVQEVPLDLEKAAKEFEGKPATAAGQECRKLLELAEYHIEDVTPENKEELLTTEEAAAALGVASQTLRNWEKKGIFIPARSDGGHRRYKRSDITTLRKQQMTGCEFIIPGIVVNEMWDMIQNILAPFDPMEKVNISIRQDAVLNKVQISVDSEDGLITINKSFNIKE